jgi:hypothetical protein
MNQNIKSNNIAEIYKNDGSDILGVPNSPIEPLQTKAQSPIERIPIELLALIFEEYTNMDLSAWDLTKISRKWKRVALSTPTLWSVLVIMQHKDNWFIKHIFLDDDGNKNIYSGNRNICFKEDQLQRCLRLCAGAPLDVLIRCVYDDEKQTNELLKCLKALMVPSNTERIRKLDLNLESQFVTRAWPECFQHARLYNIESLRMHPQMSPRWTEDLFDAMTKTTSHKHDISSTKLSEEPWVNLRYIDISATAQDFNRIAGRITQVTSIGRPFIKWPNRETPKVTFSNLVELNIRTNPFDFRRLNLPFLKRLVVQDYEARGFDESIVPEPTSLPRLIIFHIMSQYLRQWLSNAFIPNLETMILTSERKISDIDPDIFKSIPLHTLILRRFSNYEIAASILEALPSVTKLVIWDPSSDSQSLCTLIQRMTEFDDGKFIYAPNLREMVLYDNVHSISEKIAPFSTLIHDLITVRKEHNSALQTISWTDQWV